ncbi:hypothetical protein L3X38_003174 [Prunus dulcis]|uniref:Transposable element protein n=1 Tax=Prunus dulcis TaxID=3755 RepID=A0AAD5F1K3_PRUDU|nr:hypothetical protein L3X38_003174 [Prunus dulcis]
MKDLGPANYFLGMELVRTPSGLSLTQTKYVVDLLKHVNLHEAQPAPTPAISGRLLSISDGDPLPDPTEYRSTVGALQYLTLTRLDIAFAVNQMCQFMHQPTTAHWLAVKCILCYLNGTLTHGLFYSPSTLFLSGFSNADYARNPDDRRSTGGYCVYLAPCPKLWCDNISALSLTSNPVFHSRTRHVEVDYHYVHERAVRNELLFAYCSTINQIADIFTKGLSSTRFSFLRSKLHVLHRPVSLRGNKWSQKLQPGDALVGPVLPLPVLLTLHEYRNVCPNSDEKSGRFSAEAKINCSCDEVMQVTGELAVSISEAEIVDNPVTSLVTMETRHGEALKSQNLSFHISQLLLKDLQWIIHGANLFIRMIGLTA